MRSDSKVGGVTLTTRCRTGWLALTMAVLVLAAGCQEPDGIGRFKVTPVTNIILNSLGVVDEEPEVFSHARNPLPRDLVPREGEYVIGPGDVLDISIFELFSSNLEWVGRREVSATGRLTLPVIGTAMAAGRTELELTDDIIGLLSPEILRDPKVSVAVVGSRERVFSVSGSVPAPGQYPLNSTDLRLSAALAQAGGPPQTNADYAYVIRKIDPRRLAEIQEEAEQAAPAAATAAPAPPGMPAEAPPAAEQEELPSVEELLDVIAPMVLEEDAEGPLMMSMADALDDSEASALDKLEEQLDAAAATEAPTAEAEPTTPAVAEPDTVQVAYEGKPAEAMDADGKLQLVPAEQAVESELEAEAWLTEAGAAPAPAADESFLEAPPAPGPAGGESALGRTHSGYMQEVIRISLKELRSGNLNHNIVIKPGDDIQVPFNAVGVFYVGGQVARPGPYSLTGGDRLTLKQAIMTAGPLTALAWPSRCEIIRRIGEDREVTYAVNLNMLFAGAAPNVYLKPNDIINVGSHPVARWIAVVRQSFRATYGFGFVYDRNFADKDIGN